MTVLFTGGTGFIGSHVIELFLQQNIVVVALKRSSSDLAKLKGLTDKIHFFDIDKIALETVFKQHKIDTIIHIATSYGRNEDIDTVRNTNVSFPLQLLQLGCAYKVKRFINTDTFSSKFPNLSYLPAYHVTKRHFKEWGLLLAEEQGIEFISLYLQHPYGRKDNTQKFVSMIIERLVKKVPSIELTEGLQKRDFIHVKDVAAAYLAIAQAPNLVDTSFDVGSGTSCSIRAFVSTAKKIAQNSETKLLFGHLPTRNNEILDISANLTALKKLGWEKQVSLEEGILDLIDWYRLELKQAIPLTTS